MSIIHKIFVNKKVETSEEIKEFKELMYTKNTFNKYFDDDFHFLQFNSK